MHAPLIGSQKYLILYLPESINLIQFQIKSAWTGFYDYNTWDQNAIIGDHPYIPNLWFITGCSGHGIQQAPALGRALMELMIYKQFKTIDLSRFSFDRVLDGKKILERNIV